MAVLNKELKTFDLISGGNPAYYFFAWNALSSFLKIFFKTQATEPCGFQTKKKGGGEGLLGALGHY